MFNLAAEIEMHIIQTNAAKVEIETHSVIGETKISNYSI